MVTHDSWSSIIRGQAWWFVVKHDSWASMMTCGLLSPHSMGSNKYPYGDRDNAKLLRMIEDQVLNSGEQLNFEKIWAQFRQADRECRGRLSREQVSLLADTFVHLSSWYNLIKSTSFLTWCKFCFTDQSSVQTLYDSSTRIFAGSNHQQMWWQLWPIQVNIVDAQALKHQNGPNGDINIQLTYINTSAAKPPVLLE